MSPPESPPNESSADGSPSLDEILADLRAHLLWQETEGGRLVMVDASKKARSKGAEVPGKRPAVAEAPPARPLQPLANADAPVRLNQTVAPMGAPRGVPAPGAVPAGSASPPLQPRATAVPGVRATQAPTAGGPGLAARASPVPPGAGPAAARGAHPPGSAREALAAFGETPTLDEVRRAIGDCKRCALCAGRTTIVFGSGNPRAKLVFVGEGPGADEDTQGIPFVGAAGQLLTKMIEAMGYSRDDVYICNVVKCRPPNNRNPEPAEIAACEPFLQAQLAAIGPEVIVALGKFAAQTLLRDTTPITRLRGEWREYQGIPLMPTFHPAYLLRNPNEKKTVWADLKQVMTKLGKAPKGSA